VAGRDNGARRHLPRASEQEEERGLEEDVGSVSHGCSTELQPPRGLLGLDIGKYITVPYTYVPYEHR
jgi:hypothetical protein